MSIIVGLFALFCLFGLGVRISVLRAEIRASYQEAQPVGPSGRQVKLARNRARRGEKALLPRRFVEGTRNCRRERRQSSQKARRDNRWVEKQFAARDALVKRGSLSRRQRRLAAQRWARQIRSDRRFLRRQAEKALRGSIPVSAPVKRMVNSGPSAADLVRWAEKPIGRVLKAAPRLEEPKLQQGGIQALLDWVDLITSSSEDSAESIRVGQTWIEELIEGSKESSRLLTPPSTNAAMTAKVMEIESGVRAAEARNETLRALRSNGRVFVAPIVEGEDLLPSGTIRRAVSRWISIREAA